MRTMIGFALGGFIGTLFGALLVAVIAAGGDRDDRD